MSTAKAPEPLDPNFRISLPEFEGPLDLLLHLIQKHELEILDLPVAFVTEKYLAYIGLMEELDLDVASEYLVMAAKLTHIKSKMLLPAPPADQDEEGEEEFIDPRADLIRRLLEYQKYKRVAEELGGRGVAGRDVFTRGVKAPKSEGPAPLAHFDLFKLLDAFQNVLKRLDDSHAFAVDAERISIRDRITQIVDKLAAERSCTFEDLFTEARVKYDVVVTFLAILEMTKMKMLRIYQNDPGSTIHIEYRLLDANAETYPPPAGEITSDGGETTVGEQADGREMLASDGDAAFDGLDQTAFDRSAYEAAPVDPESLGTTDMKDEITHDEVVVQEREDSAL